MSVRLALALAIALAAPRSAHAHAPSDAHIALAVRASDAEVRVAGRVDVALRDLDAALALDDDGDGDLTWAEVRAAAPRITAYLDARLELHGGGGPCARAAGAPGLVDRADGTYWAAPFTATCPGGGLALRDGILFDLDPQHQAIVTVTGDAPPQTLIARSPAPVEIAIAPPLGAAAFVGAGAAALLRATLALLALLTLALPATRGVKALGAVARDTGGLALGFAVGHALLLALGGWGMIGAWSSRATDAAGAIAVVVAAVAHLRGGPALRQAIALAAGLASGAAAAAAFVDLDAPAHARAVALLAFQLGAWLALLGATLLAIPALAALRGTRAATPLAWAVAGASVAVALATMLAPR